MAQGILKNKIWLKVFLSLNTQEEASGLGQVSDSSVRCSRNILDVPCSAVLMI